MIVICLLPTVKHGESIMLSASCHWSSAGNRNLEGKDHWEKYMKILVDRTIL
ncbi:hypothetical protein NPIL_125021, partial [Nephila pilipes]